MTLENDVFLVRGDQVEWRINGHEMRMDKTSARHLAIRALIAIGWTPDEQLGLAQGELVVTYPDERQRTDQFEKLRANGVQHPELVERTIMASPWGGAISMPEREAPKKRRFTKEEAPAPPTKSATKTLKKSAPPSAAGSALEDIQLFEDPEEQLRYQVHHLYLTTVPISQREQWPFDHNFRILPSFMADLEQQSGRGVSHRQIIQAVLDVVCSRVQDVNSRKMHPLREGTGLTAHTDNAPVTRSFDRAVAYRAYVSAGTPQARRIMWWRTPAGDIELARLAIHDDMAMPER